MRRFIVATLLLSSCAPQSGVSGFTLRIGSLEPMEFLSPQLDSSYSTLVQGLVYPLLVEPSSEGGWQSQFVKEWARLGPNHYRLKLDPSVRFSDGSSVLNDDVIASLTAFGLSGVERDGWMEVEPIDPAMPIDPLLLHLVLFKASSDGLLGTGAFAIITQEKDRILLRRVQPAPGRITEIELLAFTTSRDAFARALRGEVNALLMPDAGQMELLQGVPRFRLIHAPGVQAIAAVFNARRLGRAERRALAKSLPIVDIARAHGGNCEVGVQLQPEGSILSGDPLNILVMEADPSVGRTALALRRALGPRGGAVEIEHLQPRAERVAKRLFDIIVAPVLVWPPKHAALKWRTGMPTNLGGYSNPAVDEALNAGDYDRAERELADDPPAIFICRRERSAAIDARVKNPSLGPYELLESLPEWEVSP